MKQINHKYFFLFILLIGFIGCSQDNATGPDPGEAPSIPKLEQAEPDVSYFQNNNPKKAVENSLIAETSNFYSAKGAVLSGSLYFAIGQVYGSFFNQAETAEAQFKNGVWEWSYSASYGGMTAEYKTTAEELSNGSIKWATFWSYDDRTTSIENYKMMEGTISSDGSEGDWTFNSLDAETNDEIPAITSNWRVTGDTKKDLKMEIFSGGALDTTIDYAQDGTNYVMTLSYTDQSSDVVIRWNTKTNTGSVTDGDTTSCWDSSFQNVSCS